MDLAFRGSKASMKIFLIALYLVCSLQVSLSLLANPAGEALTRLVYNLTFDIPDIDVPPVKVPLLGNTNISLDHFSCTHISILTISIQDDRETTHTDKIKLILSDIGIACSGLWAYKETKWPYIHDNGGVNVRVGQSSLGLMLTVSRRPESGVPFKISIDTAASQGCSCIFDVTELKFNGGITGDILNLLRKVISSTISSQLSKLACQEIPSIVNSAGNAAFLNISHLIESLIAVPKQSSEPPTISHETIQKLHEENHTVVDWSSWKILQVVDDIINAHLHNEGVNLVINKVIENFESEPNKISFSNLDIRFVLGNDGLSDTNVTVNKIAFENLNSLSAFQFLLPSGNYGLTSTFVLNNINMKLEGVVDLGPGSFIGHSSDGILHARAAVGINISNTYFRLTSLFALIKEKILPLTINSFIYKPACVLDSFYDINITNLIVFSRVISQSDFFFLDGGMTDLFDMILGVVGNLYGSFLNKIIRGISGGPARKFVNRFLHDNIADSHQNSTKHCSFHTKPLKSYRNGRNGIHNLVNLTQNFFFKSIDYILNDLMRIPSPIDFSINDIMDVLTKVYGPNLKSGSILLIEDVLSFSTPDKTEVAADIAIKNLTLHGLNMFDSFKVLHPLSAHKALSKISIGNISHPISSSILIKLNTVNKYRITDVEKNRLRLSIGFSNISVQAITNIFLDIDRILESSIGALRYPSCILEVCSGLNISELDLSLQDLYVELDCDACPATGFESISRALRSKVGSEQLNRYFQDALLKLKRSKILGGEWPLQKMANDGMQSILNSSTNSCRIAIENNGNKHRLTQADDRSGIFPSASFWSGICSVAFSCVGILIFTHNKICKSDECSPSRDNSAEDYNILPDAESQLSNYIDQHPGMALKHVAGAMGDKTKEAYLNDALCNSNTLPRWAKWVLPSFLMSAACMYFSGHINVGASVIAVVQIGDDMVPIPPLFSFALWNSIHDMWEAKVYPLSLLIAVFSGAWPYIKLGLLATAWFFPSTHLSPGARGTLLQCLDILGKWSLIDLIVLVMMMVAFRFHIVSPSSLHFLPPGGLEADIVVTAGWGIFAFIIATVISLILSHVMIAFHRADIGSVFDTSNKNMHLQVIKKNKKSYVCLRSFSCGNREGERYRFTRLGLILMVILVLESVVLSIIGAAVDSFSFEFLGLAGVALGDESQASYSLISIAFAVYQNDLKSFVLSSTFLLFSFIIPIAHLVVLICLWIIPMELSHQRNMFLAAEVLDAWSALEVFILSLMAAILEIGQFAAFIVGDKCHFIELILSDYLYDLVPNGDAKCFGVGVTLKAGCYTLIVAAIVGVFTGQLFTRLIEQALEDIADDENVSVRNTHVKACGEKSATLLGDCMVRIKLMEKIYAKDVKVDMKT